MSKDNTQAEIRLLEKLLDHWGIDILTDNLDDEARLVAAHTNKQIIAALDRLEENKFMELPGNSGFISGEAIEAERKRYE